ncbi:spore protein [Clostridium acetobutylicum]|nr:spore protein [Clostridium acetobutylicum]
MVIILLDIIYFNITIVIYFLNIFIIKVNSIKKEMINMSRNHRVLVPGARGGLQKLKTEASKELAENNITNPNDKQYNVGGQMVKDMIKKVEKNMK